MIYHGACSVDIRVLSLVKSRFNVLKIRSISEAETGFASAILRSLRISEWLFAQPLLNLAIGYDFFSTARKVFTLPLANQPRTYRFHDENCFHH
jgi:hypothetical protein